MKASEAFELAVKGKRNNDTKFYNDLQEEIKNLAKAGRLRTWVRKDDLSSEVESKLVNDGFKVFETESQYEISWGTQYGR